MAQSCTCATAWSVAIAPQLPLAAYHTSQTFWFGHVGVIWRMCVRRRRFPAIIPVQLDSHGICHVPGAIHGRVHVRSGHLVTGPGGRWRRGGLYRVAWWRGGVCRVAKHGAVETPTRGTQWLRVAEFRSRRSRRGGGRSLREQRGSGLRSNEVWACGDVVTVLGRRGQ